MDARRGAHRKVNATSPRLPIAGRGHPPPWLPPLCGVVGHHGIIPRFVPACPPALRCHSQDGPHHATRRRAGRSLSTPHSAPQTHTVPDRCCSSHPFPQKSGGPTSSPQAGDRPKPRVSPRFHQGHQRGGISPRQLHPLCREGCHRNPTSHPTANIWWGVGSWTRVCFASQAPARRSQHEPG